MKAKNEYLNNKNLEKNITAFQNAKYTKFIFELFVKDIKETAIKTKNRKNYKKPEHWIQLEEDYKKVTETYKEIQKELASLLCLLSQNIARYKKFKLIDDDEAIQEGVFICFEKLHLFDKTKGTAFNYMTTCIINHFKHIYRCAKNYIDLKYKSQDYYDRKYYQGQNFRNKVSVKAINSYSEDD